MQKLILIYMFLLTIQIKAYSKQLTSLEVSNILKNSGFHAAIVPIFTCIAKHESNFKPRAINIWNRNATTDFGLLQVNSAWLSACKTTVLGLLNPTINAKCALQIFKKQGFNAWYAFRKHKLKCLNYKG